MSGLLTVARCQWCKKRRTANGSGGGVILPLPLPLPLTAGTGWRGLSVTTASPVALALASAVRCYGCRRLVRANHWLLPRSRCSYHASSVPGWEPSQSLIGA